MTAAVFSVVNVSKCEKGPQFFFFAFVQVLDLIQTSRKVKYGVLSPRLWSKMSKVVSIVLCEFFVF